MYRYLFLIFYTTMFVALKGQERIDLYPAGIPNQKDGIDVEKNTPEFYRYKPEKVGSPIAFLVIPGGGYAKVAMQHEGHDVAQKLKELGYTAYVLKYRLPDSTQQIDKRIAPIQDAQSALAYIRTHENKSGTDEIKYVGVIGFSAGGHLASTLSTHFTTDYRPTTEPKTNLRPDFSVLCYPVISMDDTITHHGTKNNLIGPDFLPEDVRRFSNDLNIDSDSPPAFLMHATDDKAVPVANSQRYLKSLKAYNVSSSFFGYETGGHGFGLNNKTDVRSWFDAMIQWVEQEHAQGFQTTFEWKTKIGQVAPTFSAKGSKGETFSNQSLHGKVVLLNFFATWCPPCRAEFPQIQRQIWDKWKDRKDIFVVALAREQGWDKITPFVAEQGFTFPILPDANREIFSLFATQTIPRNVLLNKKGEIVYQSTGYSEQEFEKLVHLIESELKK